MNHGWFLEVLADLRTFALENGMTEVSAQLEDLHRVADAEITYLFGPAASNVRRSDGRVKDRLLS